MSLHHIAKHLATKGRDEDTMLVHMTPREVAGLQQIAKAAGGSLSLNPDTGLPEAGFLKSLLPMIAGGIATMFTGPLGAALVGGATGALTGDKDQSLLMRAGLGALGGFGGAGIAQGLTAAGSSAIGNAAAGSGSSLLPGGLAQGAANPVTGILSGAGGAGAGAGTVANSSLLTGAGNVLSGGATGEAARSAFMGAMPLGKYGLAAAAAPTMAEAMKTPEYDMPEDKPSKYYTTTYNPGTKNSAFGQAGEEYFTGQGYGPMQTYDSFDDYLKQTGQGGPSTGMAMGGAVPDSNYADGGAAPAAKNPLQDYMAGMGTSSMSMGSGAGGNPLQDYMSSIGNISERSAQARPATIPASTIGGRPGGMLEGGREWMGMNPMGMGMNAFSGTGTGAAPKYDPVSSKFSFAQGGIASLGGYSDGGRLLRGPGDGVSDDIPATIHSADGSKQEARLADGEFVFPARIVSEIGNGSTEAGARKLYAVMDKIQKDRGRSLKDVALDSNADRHLQALA